MNTVVSTARPHDVATEGIIEMEISRRLSGQYGAITSSRPGEYFLSNGEPPPADVVANIRAAVAADVKRGNLRREIAYRITRVVKDLTTQINIVMWLVAAENKDAKDIETARQLLAWIAATRETGRRLINENTFSTDALWPPPPDGASEFVDRF